MQTQLFEAPNDPQFSDKKLNNPKGYAGLYAFHKYWGKKPAELYSGIISGLTKENDVVLDPFVGSGVLVREALLLNRRIIASDLNPSAIELARLMANPPTYKDFLFAINEVKEKVLDLIQEAYLTKNGQIASHYIWEKDNLIEVRERVSGKIKLIRKAPSAFDLEIFQKFSNYESTKIRTLKIPENSRINAINNMQLNDLFTGRAIRNIDLLIDSFEKYDPVVKRALFLTLTSAIGQMSKMVFTIKKSEAKGYDVGSWVIGFWRPAIHFEINVWNCFENKAKKLLKALNEINSPFNLNQGTKASVVSRESNCSIEMNDAIKQLEEMPKSSISLILTDPPHGDRIPYLELSELWNSVLNANPDFSNEIVKTNAKGRKEISDSYESRMISFYKASMDKIKDDGVLAFIFNSTNAKEWKAVEAAKNYFDYLGAFPAYYSAGSVVQDNRAGSLKHDLVLLFAKKNFKHSHTKINEKFSEFIESWPDHYSANKTELEVVE